MPRPTDNFLRGAGALSDDLLQRCALEQLHDQVWLAVLIADVEDGADVRVSEGGGGARLEQKSRPHLRRTVLIVQQLDRYLAVQPLIPCPEDDAHAAAAQQGQDLVGTEPLPCLWKHSMWSLASLRPR